MDATIYIRRVATVLSGLESEQTITSIFLDKKFCFFTIIDDIPPFAINTFLMTDLSAVPYSRIWWWRITFD